MKKAQAAEPSSNIHNIDTSDQDDLSKENPEVNANFNFNLSDGMVM